jgi:hypothetical protein
MAGRFASGFGALAPDPQMTQNVNGDDAEALSWRAVVVAQDGSDD